MAVENKLVQQLDLWVKEDALVRQESQRLKERSPKERLKTCKITFSKAMIFFLQCNNK
jgi:hypothetical protein